MEPPDLIPSLDGIPVPPDGGHGWVELALQQSGIAVWRWSSADGKLKWAVDPGVSRSLFGREAPSTLDELARRLSDADADRLIRVFLESLNHRLPFRFEARCWTAAGSHRLVLAGGPSGESGDGGLVGTLAADDSRTSYDEALPDWAAAVLDDLEVGLLEWDLVTGKGQVDVRFAPRLGWPAGHVVDAAQWWEAVEPADRERARRVFESVRTGEHGTAACAFRLRTPDGLRLWVETRTTVTAWSPDGIPRRAVTAIRDATAARTEHRDQHDLHQRYRVLFEDSPIGVALVRLDEPILLDGNPRFCRMLGCGPHEVAGMPMVETWPEGTFDEVRYRAILAQARVGSMESAGWIRPLRRRDGSVCEVRMTGRVVRDADGVPSLAMMIFEELGTAAVTQRTSDEDLPFRALVEDHSELILVADEMLSVRYASPAAERRFGLKAESRPSANASQVLKRAVHPDDWPRALEAIRSATREPQGAAVVSLRAVEADGSFRECDVHLRNSLGPGGLNGLVVSVRDVSDQRRAEAATQVQLQRLRSLHMIDMAINAGIDVRMTLGVILDTLLGHLGVAAAVIRTIQPLGLDLEEAGHRGVLDVPPRRVVRVGEGLPGRAVFERRRLHQIMPGLQELARAETVDDGPFLQIAVPLIAKGQVKGVVQLWSPSERPLSETDLEFVETLAAQAAIAVDSSQLFDSLQRSNEEVLHAYDATIEGWSHALDLRDRETEGHTRRVTELTLRLARAMGVDDRELLHIRRGCLLHDIGKMGVPDRILLKPGGLDEDEWALMRMHPVYAYEWLSAIPFLQPALAIPYAHHERWDGAGYPRGLRGEEIPLWARMFAAADVFDALVSDRPYRPALPVEEAIAHLQAGSGTHFDPEVVAVFVHLWREDPAFRETYRV